MKIHKISKAFISIETKNHKEIINLNSIFNIYLDNDVLAISYIHTKDETIFNIKSFSFNEKNDIFEKIKAYMK